MPAPRIRLPFTGAFRMTQGFAEHPEVYQRFGLLGHNGIDWGMNIGTSLVAAADGKATEIAFVEGPKGADSDGFGNYVKLEHAWGQSLYAHLSKVDLKEGDGVTAGDQIGLSGNTGFSTGPHLHFGIRVNPFNAKDGWRGYVNPAWFLVGPGFNEETAGSAQLAELQRKMQDVQQALSSAQSSFDFQRQELTAQADLWRNQITDMLRRYVPGQLPPSTDPLMIMDALLQKDPTNFQRQELAEQADLWREKVTDLLRRYLPGQLPANADPLAALETLMQQWSEEIKQARTAKLASFVAPFASAQTPVRSQRTVRQ